VMRDRDSWWASLWPLHPVFIPQICGVCSEQVDISSLQLLEKDEPCAMEEAARLAKLAVPLAMQSLAAMLVSIISTTFVGHLNDPLALSAVVLSASLYNVSGMSINIGLASAMDTLCGQAFGAARYGMLGEVQQRAR